MTPQDKFDYKMRWWPGHQVRIHSDLDWKARQWCKRTLESEDVGFTSFTDVYEHTFHFKDIKAAQNFEMEFRPFTNMNKE